MPQLPTPESPWKFILRGVIPALKNERTPFVTKAGRIATRPTPEVERSIFEIKAAYNRQLDKIWPDSPRPAVDLPYQAAFCLILGVHSASGVPNQDLDNAETTVQEAMQGVILPGPEKKGDRLVYGKLGFRRPFPDRDAVYSVVYVWVNKNPSLSSFIQEAGVFLEYLKNE